MKAKRKDDTAASEWTPRISPERIRENFAEIKPPLPEPEALLEAQRCLYCEYDVPCMRGCPTKINIPRFIRQIADGAAEDAARTIMDANVFGAVCARVCPVEKLCESLCICNTLHNKPIPIGKLQRFATDRLIASGELPFRRGEPTGRRVAIVGAGPAGVSAAFELSRCGHDVVIFEKEKEPGGLDRYGIAEYKIDANFVRAEMGYLLRLGGFEIKTGREPVDPARLGRLLKDYDAVLIAVGLGPTRRLGIPGEDLRGVVDALSFIRQIKTKDLATVPVGRNVIVVGAGNTAIDAATQAKRLGAESVTVVYRRDRSHAKCTDHEYDISLTDGCEWIWETAPVEIIGDQTGRVTSARFKRKGPSGEEESFELPCDHFVKAIGQEPYRWLTEVPGLELESNRTLKVDPVTWMTSIGGLFAAGDCVKQAKEVVNAVYEGKRAAQSIDGWMAFRQPKAI